MTFEPFLTATSKDTAEGKVKTAYLLRTIGCQGNHIYSFNWTDNNDKTGYCNGSSSSICSEVTAGVSIILLFRIVLNAVIVAK